MKRDLPEWAIEMSDEEWEALKADVLKTNEDLNEKWNKEKTYTPYVNCPTCDRRLVLTLCKYDEPKHYCYEHCPGHKWQSDYDWDTECAICGVSYTYYLQLKLEEHGIEY